MGGGGVYRLQAIERQKRSGQPRVVLNLCKFVFACVFKFVFVCVCVCVCVWKCGWRAHFHVFEQRFDVAELMLQVLQEGGRRAQAARARESNKTKE